MFVSMFTQWKGSNRITSMPPASDGDAENVFECEKREREERGMGMGMWEN